MSKLELKGLPFHLGVDVHTHPRKLPPGVNAKSKNIYQAQPGVLAIRPSMREVPIYMGSSDIRNLFGETGTQIALHIPPRETNAEWIVASKSSVDVLGQSLTSTSLIPSGSDPADGTVCPIRPRIISFRGKSYAFFGSGSAAAKVLQKKAGPAQQFEVVDFHFSGSGNQDLRPLVVAPFKKRVFFGHLGIGYENYAIFSDDYAIGTVGDSALAANGRNIQIGARDGDRVTGAVEVMHTGSVASAVLLVHREFSLYQILGEPGQVADTNNFFNTMDIVRSPVNAGCSSAETIVQTPYGVLWAGPDDVWLFRMGMLPVNLGRKIRPILSRTIPTLRYMWHAAYADGFYRLALHSEGQDQTEDEPCGEQWWLDLRHGPPSNSEEALWVGPMEYRPVGTLDGAPANGTFHMVTDTRPGQPEKVFTISGKNIDAGTSICVLDGPDPYDTCHEAAPVRAWAQGTFDVGDEVIPPSQPDRVFQVTIAAGARQSGSVEPVWPAAKGNTVVDNEITWKYVRHNLPINRQSGNEVDFELLTGEQDHREEDADPILQKLHMGVEADVWAGNHHSLKLETTFDGGRAPLETTYAEVVSSGFSPEVRGGFQADADTMDDASTSLGREFRSVILHPLETARYVAKTMQYKFSGAPGYFVTEFNKTFKFKWNGIIRTATLTEGHYETLKALADHVVAQLAAAAGSGEGTVTHNIGAGTPRPNLVVFTHTVSAMVFYFVNDGSVVTVEPTIVYADLQQHRRLMSVFGIDTFKDYSATTITAMAPARHKQVSLWEISDLVARFKTIRRRPT